MSDLYTYHKNKVCLILAGLLEAEEAEEVKIINPTYRKDGSVTYGLWNKWLQNAKKYGQITQRGGCGRESLIEWDAIPSRYQDRIKKYGDPYEATRENPLEKYLTYSPEAENFFKEHRKPNGKPLSKEKQEEYYNNAIIYKAINAFVSDITLTRRSMGGNVKGIWPRVAAAVNDLDPKAYPHSVPSNYRSIQRKNARFVKEGLAGLLHKGEGNDNSAKITGDVAEWILATYCLPNKIMIPVLLAMYDDEREDRDWPQLTESAINRWLNESEQRRIWVLARHGKETWIKEFGHHLKRDRENWFPNAWWAVDGSKLDWVHYYDTALGMAAKLKINPLIDVYSEKIIGWSYSETEDHTDHFKSLKMAVNESMARPYLLTYDNQSGHKSGRMQKLYSQITATGGTHYPHKAYKKSNPIEQVFGRLQQQVVNQMWFSDKQTIKARRDDSLPNMDFLKENKHQLLSREDLEKAWEMCVRMWNSMPHPKFKHLTRDEVYEQEAPHRHDVSPLEMVSLFFIEENTGSTYRRGGLQLTVAKRDYEYEVYNTDGTIDLNFRKKYVGAKFIVKYDPTALDQYIGLYQMTPEGKEELITYAEPKRSHESIPILMQDGQKEAWRKDYEVSEMEYERDLKEYQDLVARTGISPQKLIDDQNLMIKMGGKLPKEQRSKVESESFLNRL